MYAGGLAECPRRRPRRVTPERGPCRFLRPTPCHCAGARSAVHAHCLRRWQTIARANLQWAAGSTCHACNSGYTVNLADDGTRIPMGILGGTGLVGRKLAARLVCHPLFSLGPVLGSSATAGQLLSDVWRDKEKALEDHYGRALWEAAPVPDAIEGILVASVEALFQSNCKYVISCIAPALGHLEDALQRAGVVVFSISPHDRNVARNPLVVPEANGDDLLLSIASAAREPASFCEDGSPRPQTVPLIKSPNCVTCGVSVVLKALEDAYGVEGVSVTTFQALSGRGDAKYDRDLVVANVYPLAGTIERTDEYQRAELLRIFPRIVRCAVSAHRVPVQNGHFVDLKIQTRSPVRCADDVKRVLREFAPLSGLGLPSMPRAPIVVVDEAGRPRPKVDSDYEGGMSVCVGNVNTNDGFFDVSLSLVVNNVVRGAWGAALLNAELYELHIRPLVGRAAPKVATHHSPHKAPRRSGDVMAPIEKLARTKVDAEGSDHPQWGVLLRWAKGKGSSGNLAVEAHSGAKQHFGVGPWEEADDDATS
ncbi:hypothetical protein M885DRAFT_508778 [Pelagophyceae sp. CCMP2097]|nr:hypothetical protein M885DRAFT_508778 [Pelagophyceae sp. CCMP2097]